ncbi:unnamed protein product [Cyprideis torosa]|uniref:Uncharacterized protein n=1 Tax=Cyprideis torosa TaxID=163714 RepID=A0A7R8WWC5_9CRUS|nr:unnamed protein product [Cyprideis torosa]CAG0908312.1 unnamed protein product [Cyprideis torosa]
MLMCYLTTVLFLILMASSAFSQDRYSFPYVGSCWRIHRDTWLSAPPPSLLRPFIRHQDMAEKSSVPWPLPGTPFRSEFVRHLQWHPAGPDMADTGVVNDLKSPDPFPPFPMLWGSLGMSYGNLWRDLRRKIASIQKGIVWLLLFPQTPPRQSPVPLRNSHLPVLFPRYVWRLNPAR